MKYKRLIAYLIDFAILCIFIFMVSIFFQTSNINHLQIEMSSLNDICRRINGHKCSVFAI